MILLFALGLFVSVAALWLSPLHHYAVLAMCFFTVGFFVFGPQMLIGLAAVECSHKEAAGTVTGRGKLLVVLESLRLPVKMAFVKCRSYFSVLM